jgi:hypothetical protein
MNLAGPVPRRLAVLAVARPPVHLHPPLAHVDDPHLAHAAARVQRPLHRAVEAQRAVGHFDQQQHVVRARQARKRVGLHAQQREVGLRLRPSVEDDGVAGRNQGGIAGAAHQHPVQPIDDPRVRRPDRRHLQHLALDELDARIGWQDAGLAHPVVVGDAEAPPGGRVDRARAGK